MGNSAESRARYNEKRRQARAEAKARGERLKSDQTYLERKRQARAEAKARGELIPADERTKQRRALKRKLAKLEKQQKQTKDKSLKKELTKQKRDLKKQIDNTYLRKQGKTAKKQSGKSTKKTTKISKTVKQTEKGFTSDKVFQDAMATALRDGSFDGMSSLSVQLFWRATVDMWRGVPLGERVQAIKDALGVDSLYDAYRTVMFAQDVNMYVTDLDAYFEMQGIDTTDEEYQDAEYSEDKYETAYYIVR